MKGWDSRVTTSYYKQPLLSRCRQSYPLYKNFIVYPQTRMHTHTPKPFYLRSQHIEPPQQINARIHITKINKGLTKCTQ